jgi:hypothetical protein
MAFPIPWKLIATIEYPLEEEGALIDEHPVQTVDLRKQGFNVFWRALLRRNKHVYVPGRSSLAVNTPKQ